MWIEDLPNRKYKYVERYTDPLTQKYKKVSVTLDKNTKQMFNKANIILQDKIADKLAIKETDNITYGELKKEYLDQWIPTVRDSTRRAYAVSDKHISKVLDDNTLIKNISKRDIRNIITKLLKNNTYHVTHKCRKRLHAIFAYAIQMDYLALNPTENVLVPKPAEEYNPNKVLFLSSEDVNKLIDDIIKDGNQTLADVVLFQFLTGLRYGELAGLTRDKIDYKNKEITVNATYDFNLNKLTKTKTKSSTRVISVSDNILDILQRQKQMTGNPYIFCSIGKKPIHNAVINKMLKKYGNYHTHLFRHSHISFLAEKGIPLNAIMDRVGHSDPKTTLSIYSHTTVNMRKLINEQTAPFMPLIDDDIIKKP